MYERELELNNKLFKLPGIILSLEFTVSRKTNCTIDVGTINHTVLSRTLSFD